MGELAEHVGTVEHLRARVGDLHARIERLRDPIGQAPKLLAVEQELNELEIIPTEAEDQLDQVLETSARRSEAV